MSYKIKTNIGTGSLAFRGINTRVPGGAKGLFSGPLDFTQSLQYVFDLTSIELISQLSYKTMTLYIDCSECLYTDTLITCGDQSIICKAGTQGYYSMIVMSPIFQVTNYIAALAQSQNNTNTATAQSCNNLALSQAFSVINYNNCIVKIWFLNVSYLSHQWQAREKQSVNVFGYSVLGVSTNFINLVQTGGFAKLKTCVITPSADSYANANSTLTAYIQGQQTNVISIPSRYGQASWLLPATIFSSQNWQPFVMQSSAIDTAFTVLYYVSGTPLGGTLSAICTFEFDKSYGSNFQLSGYDV